MGMLELAQQFERTGSRFRVKREGLFTIDDARHNDLIYVGSPSSALGMGEILGTREFTFRRQEPAPIPTGGRLSKAIRDREKQPSILELPTSSRLKRTMQSLLLREGWIHPVGRSSLKVLLLKPPRQRSTTSATNVRLLEC